MSKTAEEKKNSDRMTESQRVKLALVTNFMVQAGHKNAV